MGIRRKSDTARFRELKCLYPWSMPKKSKTGVVQLYPMRCGWCWACSTNKANDMIGRVASAALLCTQVQLWTLTYDDAKGVEAQLGGKIRIVEHLQNFQKAMRQREIYHIKKWNKANPDKWIDPSRSYIKFLAVHEYGTKGTKRSHFHVLVFFESHFPIPVEAILTGDFRQTSQHAKRVWDLPAEYGPYTQHRPGGADNPDVIDYRCCGPWDEKKRQHKHGRQVHGLWPWGFVNVQNVTHDCNNLQNGEPTAKAPYELGSAVMYLDSYFKKNFKLPKGVDPRKMHLASPEKQMAFAESMKRSVFRTYSLGLGNEYAIAKAKQHATAGIPPKHLHYHIEGFLRNRSPQAMEKLRRRLAGQGLNQAQIEQQIEHRRTFTFKGSQRDAFFAAYKQTREQKLGRKLRLGEMGDQLIQYVIKTRRAAANSFLRSREASTVRDIELKKGTRTLEVPTELELLPYWEEETIGYVPNSDPDKPPVPARHILNGRNGLGGPESVKMDIEKRFHLSEQQIAFAIRCYDKSIAKPHLLESLKQHVSQMPLDELLTEELFEKRKREQTDRFKRPADQAKINMVRIQLKIQADNGDENACEQLAFLDEYEKKSELEAFGLPRFDLHHPHVDRDTLWEWINTSDDYGFPALREQLIKRFCGIYGQYEGNLDQRIIVNPKGEEFIQRRAFSSKTDYRKSICWETGKIIRGRAYARWSTRKLEPGEADSGKILSLKHPMQSDPIFSGSNPLKFPEQYAPRQSLAIRQVLESLRDAASNPATNPV